MPNTFAEIVDEVRELDDEAKRELAALLKSWLIEDRRSEIIANAENTEAEYSSGQTKSGDIDNLIAD